jgi:hypothetical protein
MGYALPSTGAIGSRSRKSKEQIVGPTTVLLRMQAENAAYSGGGSILTKVLQARTNP